MVIDEQIDTEGDSTPKETIKEVVARSETQVTTPLPDSRRETSTVVVVTGVR